MGSTLNKANCFLYDADVLIRPLSETTGENQLILDKGRRKWSVSEGDSLLFVQGRGLELKFRAISKVFRVYSERNEDERGRPIFVLTVATSAPTFLSDDLTLGRLMYSLTSISNFSKPWLHLRHKARVNAVDLETLLEGRIAWDRTVFFGLLQNLPGKWREFLEARSRAMRVTNHLLETSYRWSPAEPEPVRELLSLIEETILAPSRLAADIHSDWAAVFGRAPHLGPIRVVGESGEPEAWNLSQTMNISALRRDSLESYWRLVNELPMDDTITERRVKWRRHHW